MVVGVELAKTAIRTMNSGREAYHTCMSCACLPNTRQPRILRVRVHERQLPKILKSPDPIARALRSPVDDESAGLPRAWRFKFQLSRIREPLALVISDQLRSWGRNRDADMVMTMHIRYQLIFFSRRQDTEVCGIVPALQEQTLKEKKAQKDTECCTRSPVNASILPFTRQNTPRGRDRFCRPCC